MKDKQIFSIVLRYLILLIAAFGNLYVFYLIFTPLTLYCVYFLSKLFSSHVFLSQDFIIVGEKSFRIIEACVAGSAYYLLLILNLSTPDIKLSSRIKSILFSFIIFFILNVIRILILVFIFFISPETFTAVHKIFWYALSTIFLIAIWFFQVKIFKIKEIPIYSDVLYLKNKSILKKKIKI